MSANGMSNQPERLHGLLSTDPLADAEKITGQSYKEDERTMALGFLMHLAHNDAKKAALEQAHDSYFNMNLEDTLSLYADMGFAEVLRDEFKAPGWGAGDPMREETYRVLWHEDGILATVESYDTTGRNSTKIYYNVQVADAEAREWSNRISSGRLHGGVWVGDHDAREGVRNAIARWQEVGDFLPVWTERPFLWLVTYAETRDEGYDHAAITDGRVKRLPQHVQAAIAGGAA